MAQGRDHGSRSHADVEDEQDYVLSEGESIVIGDSKVIYRTEPYRHPKHDVIYYIVESKMIPVDRGGYSPPINDVCHSSLFDKLPIHIRFQDNTT